jgi:uncharacterized protein
MKQFSYPVIDSHIHCGVQHSNLGFEIIKPRLTEGGIDAACLFAPVEDIYDRNNFNFKDTKSWQETRSRANSYIKDLGKTHHVYPYFFVWNDFNVSELDDSVKGVKWHRHRSEPLYEYDNPKCETFLNAVFARKLPIVIEEVFENTIEFARRVNGRTNLIIPHLGLLNGGYSALKKAGIWEAETVYADSALALPAHVKDFVNTYGASKLLFGSDFPFGEPLEEKYKILTLGFGEAETELILSGNVRRLIGV